MIDVKVEKALNEGFYRQIYTYPRGSTRPVAKYSKVKVPLLKLDSETHTHLVICAPYQRNRGYEEFEISEYGITWALTIPELKGGK